MGDHVNYISDVIDFNPEGEPQGPGARWPQHVGHRHQQGGGGDTERIKHLVYLAAVVPKDNDALIDLLTQERQGTLRKLQGRRRNCSARWSSSARCISPTWRVRRRHFT